ncbi:hypothetical protein HK405_004927, partial [Cladochytrium tenue]
MSLSDSGTTVNVKGGGSGWKTTLAKPEQARSFVYSPDGNLFALAYENSIEVVNARTLEPVSTIELKNPVEMAFSPNGAYLSTWVRFVKGVGDDEAHKNLCIWLTATATPACSFTQKTQNGWNVQWLADGSCFARQVSDGVHFFDPTQTGPAGGAGSPPVAARLKVDGIKSFSLSPNRSGRSSVAVFIGEKKGAPAAVRLFDYAKLSGAPLSPRTTFNADLVDYLWSADGCNLLAWIHTEVDKTNQSYYGKSTLHYLTVDGAFDSRVDLGDGPIHAVAWSPNSREFVAIHGVMPAQATLFDHRANPIYSFGAAHRNAVSYSPHGRFVAIGGFGNLKGDIDVWDRATFTRLATIHADNCSLCEWAPDGRHLLTATVYRRLKVDNGILLWHYSGVLVHRIAQKELYAVAWRHDDPLKWPRRGNTLSPPPKPMEGAAAVAPAAPKGVYRPPGARGRDGPSFS